MSLRWMIPLLSLQLRKLVSYRVDFWVQFVGTVVIHLCVAFFMWKAVFDFNGITELRGMTFPTLLFYYFLVPFLDRMFLSEAGAGSNLSSEIYDGTLTRYLIYPLSVFPYRFVIHFGQTLVVFLQMLFGLSLVVLTVGIPDSIHISWQTWLLALPALFMASYLSFALFLLAELIAFWADNVWSLLVMVRFSITMLGGALLPLAMFPEGLQQVLYRLPFALIIHFPIQTLIGNVGFDQWLELMGLGFFWALLTTGIALVIFQRGCRQYTGVGI